MCFVLACLFTLAYIDYKIVHLPTLSEYLLTPAHNFSLDITRDG